MQFISRGGSLISSGKDDETAVAVGVLKGVYQKRGKTQVNEPHPGLITASCFFLEPFPIVCELELLSISIMDLLLQYAYPSLEGYAKFIILLTMKKPPGEDRTFSIGNAIPFTFEDNTLIPTSDIYKHITSYILK